VSAFILTRYPFHLLSWLLVGISLCVFCVLHTCDSRYNDCFVFAFIGDPSVFGNLDPAQECLDAVVEAVQSGKYNGYPNSVGYMETREAIAQYSTDMGAPATAQDVVVSSGCSQALDLCITLLANPGQNILIPKPGFSIYKTLAEGVGVETKYYDLKPDDEWNVDIAHLSSQIDDKTAAVIVNSPSNPCGGVFSLEHMQEIIDVCEKHKVPIISDEVYEHVVYDGRTHYPFGAVSKTVPVFTVSAISKRFLVPGWRLGWVIIHDRAGAITPQIRSCLTALTQRILGPCSLIQGALPKILRTAPKAVFDHTNNLIQENSRMFYELLSSMKGLEPIKPSGAMYMMVRIDLDSFPDFANDIDFTERLMTEESVFCLPASCFAYPGFFRIVLSIPNDKAVEACERLILFCDRHYMHSVPEPLDSNGEPLSLPTKTKKLPPPLTRITSDVYLLGANKR